MTGLVRIGALAAAVLVTIPFAPATATVTAPPISSENVEHVNGVQGWTGGHVAIDGDRLYVGAYGIGLRIYDISDVRDPSLIGEYSPGGRADAVPAAARFGKRRIAILNGTRRTASTQMSEFLDVTDPQNPVVLHTFMGPEDGEAHNGDIVRAGKLWLPSGGNGEFGLRIYDLRPVLKKDPQAPKLLFNFDPGLLWELSPHRKGRDVGNPFTHTHDITIYMNHPVNGKKRDIALLAEGGNYTGSGNTGSVFIIDITNPRRPVVLNRWVNDSGHAIRYYHEAMFLDGNRSVMVVADEDLHNGCGSAGGVAAVAVSKDLTKAEKLSEWFIPLGSPAPVCSAHVFSSKRNLVYMGAYNAGLQVIDYSDPENPTQAGHYIAEGSTAWGALWHKGVVYVGDMSRGLDVFEYTGPE